MSCVLVEGVISVVGEGSKVSFAEVLIMLWASFTDVGDARLSLSCRQGALPELAIASWLGSGGGCV